MAKDSVAYVMNAADNAALDAGKELAKQGELTQFPIEKLKWSGNVRTEACLQLSSMVASQIKNGYKPNHPAVISLHADGMGLVLCGNRRTLAVCIIRNQQPEVYAQLFPKGTIPAIVYTGLTEAQEIVLRLDHSQDEDRVPLDAYSEFLSVCQLVRAGYGTEAGIAAKLGHFVNRGDGTKEPARSWAQQRVTLASLPQECKDAFRDLCNDSKSTNFRMTHIPKLSKAINDDVKTAKKANVNPVSPEGKDFADGGGPLYVALWNKIISGGFKKPDADEGTETGDESEDSKMMSRTDLVKRTDSFESVLLKSVVRVITGERTSPTLVELDGQLAALERDASILANIAKLPDYAKILKKAQTVTV